MAARVLIVDDEPNIIATVAPLLRAQGYEVFSAMTGQAGLEAVGRDRPDLLVLDLGLPDIDGVDVCVRVRQSSSMPILVLSARGAAGAGCRSGRQRHDAVRHRRVAGPNSRRAQARRDSASDRATGARRSRDR